MNAPGTVIFHVDGRSHPLTVEEAWTLRSHLPESDAPLGGASGAIAVRLEQLCHEADGMAHPSPAMTVFVSEKGVLYRALENWLHAVKAPAFPAQAMNLRYALFVENLGELAFRDVLFRFADGSETREREVVVTGDPFEHGGRWWVPQAWHAERDDAGEVVVWMLCAERA